MRDFRKLDIWKDSMSLAIAIYKLVESFPKEEKYGLRRQISRSAISIPSNIAEGCSRTSERDFKRFLEIAIGSAFELETQLWIAAEVGMILKPEFDETLNQLDLLEKRINALIAKLN